MLRKHFFLTTVCSLMITCLHLPTGLGATILPGGQIGDNQTSIGYRQLTGEVFVDAPLSAELTSIRIASANGLFTGDAADHLVFPPAGFDIDEDGVIFKSTLGSSFGSLSFGNVASPGLSESNLLGDIDVTGSLAGGGDLGPVDLIFIPEPSSTMLLLWSAIALGIFRLKVNGERLSAFVCYTHSGY